uniref:Uncharacterized protein n=1 Tax=Pseudictyota dubia TaxID=2749911 RepID=A0A7R9WKD5_9STRA|mmetsp:Transcript_6237/g.10723  ORF Transcript_6237/g.10723 Transcript_6237/m.10723 type:complete len:205 (+) Transcript_6237:1332-1946(+)
MFSCAPSAHPAQTITVARFLFAAHRGSGGILLLPIVVAATAVPQERRCPVHRPLPPVLVSTLPHALVVRLELILVVPLPSIFPHLLNLGLHISLLLLLGGLFYGGVFGLRREQLVPDDALIDDVVRIRVVKKFEIGVGRVGVRVLRGLFVLFVVVRVVVFLGRKAENQRHGMKRWQRSSRNEGRAAAGSAEPTGGSGPPLLASS